MVQPEDLIQARFVWRDGYIDYRMVPHNYVTWKRYRHDRDDKYHRDFYDRFTWAKEMQFMELAWIVTFNRTNHSDGSFEFIEYDILDL